MNGIWDQFAGNLAFVGLAIAVWAHLSIWFSRQWAGGMRYALGLATGATAIGSIILAVEVSPGVFVDIRHAPLALAAMFGGPVAAIIAGAMIIAFRLWVGGAAVFDGIATVVIVAALGLAIHAVTRQRQPRFSDIAVLTAGLAIVLIAALSLLPTISRINLLKLAGLELILLNCGGAVEVMIERGRKR